MLFASHRVLTWHISGMFCLTHNIHYNFIWNFKILFFPPLLDIVHSFILNRLDDSLASLGSGSKAPGMWRERYFTEFFSYYFKWILCFVFFKIIFGDYFSDLFPMSVVLILGIVLYFYVSSSKFFLTSFECFVSHVIFCLLSNNILQNAVKFCVIWFNVVSLNCRVWHKFLDIPLNFHHTRLSQLGRICLTDHIS